MSVSDRLDVYRRAWRKGEDAMKTGGLSRDSAAKHVVTQSSFHWPKGAFPEGVRDAHKSPTAGAFTFRLNVFFSTAHASNRKRFDAAASEALREVPILRRAHPGNYP